MIDPPSSSTITVVVGSPLTFSCTSQGSPPDTFIFMKDGMPVTPPPSINPVTHTDSMAMFRANYSIISVTTSDSGTYTCTVTNPIGSDTETITVNVFSKFLCMLNFVWIFLMNYTIRNIHTLTTTCAILENSSSEQDCSQRIS